MVIKEIDQNFGYQYLTYGKRNCDTNNIFSQNENLTFCLKLEPLIKTKQQQSSLTIAILNRPTKGKIKVFEISFSRVLDQDILFKYKADGVLI